MVNVAGEPREHTKRVALPLTEQEITEIDSWGFARRIRDRSAVLRELVRTGLAASAANEVTTEQKV